MRSPGGLSRLEERGEWKSEEVIHITQGPKDEGRGRKKQKKLKMFEYFTQHE